MVLSGSRVAAGRPAEVADGTPQAVVWHQLECGSYRADLPLWREVAEQSPGPILDVGAGSGRVALELARAGHTVTALDRDPVLLDALAARGAGSRIQTATADARSFTLNRRDFALCVVPMQTIQLLGGARGRVAFLRRARAHLRPSGIVACAILSELEPFDCASGDIGPAAETVRVDGMLYVSRATRVCARPRGALIERERWIILEGAGTETAAHHDAAHHDAARVERFYERNVVELDRVSARDLEREAVEAGLRPEPARVVAATEDHVGSVVVMLRA